MSMTREERSDLEIIMIETSDSQAFATGVPLIQELG